MKIPKSIIKRLGLKENKTVLTCPKCDATVVQISMSIYQCSECDYGWIRNQLNVRLAPVRS